MQSKSVSRPVSRHSLSPVKSSPANEGISLSTGRAYMYYGSGIDSEASVALNAREKLKSDRNCK